ncbi:arylamine N-acetyltransferase [Mycolicibacterium thermoresistibile]|jgi:hypothetical protein|uniref:Arylamine N-acetyltransferase n=1 Tax=Mycolicibacterium thermoresistibile TaxID=1797 RepID=A0A100XIT2_MYCTH|nr:arylamine N-acetyltransferase [Mycolicibacterium thermoresistibile]GAT17188.1 arylamine N-acetyltransferase [Mycolicibacterium thermoresistibile]
MTWGRITTAPLRLQPGLTQPSRHEPNRLGRLADGHRLETRIRDTWEPLHLFTATPRHRIDTEVAGWSPAGTCRRIPARRSSAGCRAIVTDDARINLRGRQLAVHRAGFCSQGCGCGPITALDAIFGVAPWAVEPWAVIPGPWAGRQPAGEVPQEKSWPASGGTAILGSRERASPHRTGPVA